jgi:flagellar protein FliJ
MSAVDSLIRLHRWQLDERRRELADLEALAEKLRQDGVRLVEEKNAEQAIAATSPEALSAYAGYARRFIERRVKLEQSLASVEARIALARDTLAESYQEVKRYEIAANNRAMQQRKRLERVQQATLDEVGIENFRRKKKN